MSTMKGDNNPTKGTKGTKGGDNLINPSSMQKIPSVDVIKVNEWKKRMKDN